MLSSARRSPSSRSATTSARRNRVSHTTFFVRLLSSRRSGPVDPRGDPVRCREKRVLLKPYSGLHPYPDEAGAGPGLSPGRPFFLGHLLMQWTVVAIAIGGGADGAGEPPSPVSREDPQTSSTPPRPASLSHLAIRTGADTLPRWRCKCGRINIRFRGVGATVRSLHGRDRGGGVPPPRQPHPARRYPTVHSMGKPENEQGSGSLPG